MHTKICFVLLVATLVVACSRDDAGDAIATIDYPETATVEHVDDYHGKQIADPYRWLEDDVRESDAVKEWVDAQNDVTFAYLATIPERQQIANRMRELWDYERFSLPRKAGSRYFYGYNDGLQNQDVLYTQTALDGEPELLIDPNTWSDDGTIALAGYWLSKDGSHIAYTIQDGGSDWREARVLNVDSGEGLDDHLKWLKFTGLSWTADGTGFYYSRYPEVRAEENLIYRHKCLVRSEQRSSVCLSRVVIQFLEFVHQPVGQIPERQPADDRGKGNFKILHWGQRGRRRIAQRPCH